MSARDLVAVSFGGGVNSAAMVVGMLERKERPDWILFADTGGERPETYAFLDTFRGYLAKHDLALTVVSNGGRGQGATLEENCLMRHELPSLAYGFKGCSVKWKRQPMDRWLRDQPEVSAAWGRGELVTRCIGIDAGETKRAKLPPDNKWTYRYPLVEWGWDRAACVAACDRHGLRPGKSSCFFCPAAKKAEIRDLATRHPDLFARAVAIERNAVTHTVRGLGRTWSWESYMRQPMLPGCYPETMDLPCDCHTSSEDD